MKILNNKNVNHLVKKIIFWFILGAIAIFGLSFFANVPYIYTILGIRIWMFIGHLATLDDDEPGGWSNLNNSKAIWKNSLIELFIKFLIVLFIISIILIYPNIKKYGV